MNRNATPTMARLAPNVLVEDGVVPRDQLPEVVRRIQAITKKYELKAGLLFHAGDGNIHPLLLFDRRKPRDVEAVVSAGTDILTACIALGGTISGEHGIGYEKRATLPLVFDDGDIATMLRLRDTLDPHRTFNPDKIFPSGVACGEVRAAS